jgi:hypothetical protein
MRHYQNTVNKSVQDLEWISQRIATIAKELDNYPEYKEDYKNALEVVVILLTELNQQL